MNLPSFFLTILVLFFKMNLLNIFIAYNFEPKVANFTLAKAPSPIFLITL